MASKLEIDWMEYSSDALAQVAYASNGTFRSNADIKDEDMADITDWTDNDSGTGVSSQATFDSKSCMKLDTGATSGAGNQGSRIRDVGSYGDRTVFSMNVYCDAIGTLANTDILSFTTWNGSGKYFGVEWASDGLRVISTIIGTNLVVQDTWQEWTFDVNWTTGNIDVYLNKKLVGSATTGNDTYTQGLCILTQYAYTTANRISYIDWVKVGSVTLGGLESYSESTIKTQGSYALKAAAAITDSLNKTLTHTFSPSVDLSGVNILKLDMRASRTGANIKVGLNNSTISNADIDNEDMADITDWTDADSVSGDSSQVTFDGKSCMKLDTGATNNSRADRVQDIGSFSGISIFSMSVFCAAVGLINSDQEMFFTASNGALTCVIAFASDGLFVFNGSSYDELGTNLVVQNAWQEWTFAVNWTAQTVDVYLNRELKATGFDCSYTTAPAANGTVRFYINGYGAINRIAYVDWFKAGSNFVGNNVTTELTPTIIAIDTIQTVTWDLSAVTDANKNAIDTFIITPTNADAANIIYIDDFKIPVLGVNVFGII